MYKFTAYDKIKLINKTKLAHQIGVSASYLNRVLNGKIKCSKIVAYCVTKTLDDNCEISDFFIQEII